VVAIGDVHGCATLLRQTLQPHLGSGAELIFLGDLVDRSPEEDGDRQVLELVRELQANPQAHGLAAVTVLRGNHEQMLLDALAEKSPGEAMGHWQWNGGNPGFLPVAREHRSWLKALPHFAIRGTVLFVHAGVRPGVRLKQQRLEELLWIRAPFLKRPHGLPYTVVHGHTFRKDYRITRLPHRIGMDTGAFKSGKLTALSIYPWTPQALEVGSRSRSTPTAERRDWITSTSSVVIGTWESSAPSTG
jgi:serine/threonine protein phosphatase 1